MKRKFTNLLTLIILIVIIIIMFVCVAEWVKRSVTSIKENIETKQEQKRLDWILEQINELYILNDEYATQWQELEQQQVQLHESAETNREQIKELRNEYYKDKDTWNVMNAICEKAPNSPMCNDYVMLEELKNIANSRWVDYKILLGIMYAESHIWSNFNAEQCRSTNNWAGLKARKYDDWTVSEWFDKQEWRIEGCWLYKFEDVETFFESLANTIWIWYKKCNNDIYCISKAYVWHESGSRVNNVYKFYSIK